MTASSHNIDIERSFQGDGKAIMIESTVMYDHRSGVDIDTLPFSCGLIPHD
jgi:hypothetical protein